MGDEAESYFVETTAAEASCGEGQYRVYPPDLCGVNPDHRTVREISGAERELASTLARTLINRRHELGKTQEQVALEAGLDRNHYQLMEHARSDRKSNYPLNPRLSTLISLAEVLECEVNDLLADALARYKVVASYEADLARRNNR